MNVILTMSTFIFPLITFPYVSRILQPEGLGKVSFATSLITYFNMFAQLGIPTYGIRACARVRDDREMLSRTVQEIFLINLIMSVAAYVLLGLVLLTVPRLQGEKLLYIIVSLGIFFNTIGMEWLYKALEQYTYITVRSIAFKIVAIIAMFMLVHAKKDYVIYGAITILAASASSIFNFAYAGHFVDRKPCDGLDLKKHLKPVLVFFGMSCATTIYLHLDTLMLGFMKSDVDVGYYHTAVRIKTILVSVVTSLGAVLLPRCSYYVENSMMEEFRRICRKALNFVWILATPLMVYFILYAAQGIRFLSGSAYGGSVVPMQIIMPTLLFIGLSNILGIQVLIPLGKERVVLMSEIAGAVVDMIINLLLIPRYASAGAAFGTTIAEAVVLGIQCWALRDTVPDLLKPIRWWKTLVSVLVASAACWWVQYLPLGTFLTLVISAALFFGVYGLLMLLFKEQMTVELTEQVLEKLKESKYIERVCGNLYIAACALYIFSIVVSRSGYADMPSLSILFKGVRAFCYIVILAKCFLDFCGRRYSLKEIGVLGAVGAFLLVSARVTGVKNPLIYWVFIAAGKNVDYRRLMTWAAIAHFAGILCVVGSCRLGILENVIRYRSEGTAREYLGFSYTTESANFFFYGVAIWVFARGKRIRFPELLVLALFGLGLYVRTDTKSAFILTMAALAASLMLKLASPLRTWRRGYRWIGVLVVPAAAAFIILVTVKYDPGVAWLSWLNSFLTGRLRYGAVGLERYGIRLLGQPIEWIGGTPDDMSIYNYVDSSFLQSLLNFGPIFLGLMILGMMRFAWSIGEHKDVYMLLAFVLVIVHGTFDPQLIWIEFNSLWLAYSYLTGHGETNDGGN
ncbi:MAG: oligosaccharide flippase family protein [Lachnospiraceae bacterium]|nr:oligosaccharide flippase family protein [Lachnospiraceae bacterium]